MNEELKEKLNNMSLELIDSIQKGAEWTTQQTSLFVKELVNVYIIENSIHFFCWLVVSICLALSGNMCLKQSKHEDTSFSDRPLYTALSVVLFSSALIIFTFNLGVNGADIAKGIWAPRVVVVEHLKELIK
jgi:hypothetical protein